MNGINTLSNEELKDAFINQNEFEHNYREAILKEVESRGLFEDFKVFKVKKEYNSELLILRIKTGVVFLFSLILVTYLKTQYYELTGDRVVLVWFAPFISGLYYYFKKREIDKRKIQ